MPRAPRVILETPEGFKRCRHCVPSANTFIDIRSKANECDVCRQHRKKSREKAKAKKLAKQDQDGASSSSAAVASPHDPNIANFELLEAAVNAVADKHTQLDRVFPRDEAAAMSLPQRETRSDGRRSTKHLTTADTVVLFQNKEDALQRLAELARTEDAFLFHARYVVADPPECNAEKDEDNKQLVVDYLHKLNAEITDTIEWRFTSRGRENRHNLKKSVGVHYACCQDQSKQRKRTTKAKGKAPEHEAPDMPVDPHMMSEGLTAARKSSKRTPMELFPCAGRLHLSYELETHIVELRLIHEYRHEAYSGRRGGRASQRESVPLDEQDGQPAVDHEGGIAIPPPPPPTYEGMPVDGNVDPSLEDVPVEPHAGVSAADRERVIAAMDGHLPAPPGFQPPLLPTS